MGTILQQVCYRSKKTTPMSKKTFAFLEIHATAGYEFYVLKLLNSLVSDIVIQAVFGGKILF